MFTYFEYLFDLYIPLFWTDGEIYLLPCLRACLLTYIPTYLLACLLAYLLTYIPTYLLACLLTYLRMKVDTIKRNLNNYKSFSSKIFTCKYRNSVIKHTYVHNIYDLFKARSTRKSISILSWQLQFKI